MLQELALALARKELEEREQLESDLKSIRDANQPSTDSAQKISREHDNLSLGQSQDHVGVNTHGQSTRDKDVDITSDTRFPENDLNQTPIPVKKPPPLQIP